MLEIIKELQIFCLQNRLDSLELLNDCRDKGGYIAGVCSGEMIAYKKILDLLHDIAEEKIQHGGD